MSTARMKIFKMLPEISSSKMTLSNVRLSHQMVQPMMPYGRISSGWEWQSFILAPEAPRITIWINGTMPLQRTPVRTENLLSTMKQAVKCGTKMMTGYTEESNHGFPIQQVAFGPVSYTHLRAHEK